MIRRGRLLGTVALTALCAGCGSSATPVVGPPPAQSTPRTSPGTVTGEIVATRGATTIVETPDGSDSRFSVEAATTVTQQTIDDVSDLTVGSCAFATGERDVRGDVVAARVLITAYGPTGCSRPGAGVGGGSRGAGGAGGPAVAGGEITAIRGMVVTVMGTSGVDHFTAGPTTPVSRLVAADLGTLHIGLCVVVRGTPEPSGEVLARTVAIVPASTGGCFAARGAAAGGPGQ
jgi:hypothetical protein